MEKQRTVLLREVAHGRTGDKGDLVNISLICRYSAIYSLIQFQVTEERLLSLFEHRGAYAVDRYELPKLSAFNYVIHGALGGGVNRSPYLDRHGKGLSEYLLDQTINIPFEISLKIGNNND